MQASRAKRGTPPRPCGRRRNSACCWGYRRRAGGRRSAPRAPRRWWHGCAAPAGRGQESGEGGGRRRDALGDGFHRILRAAPLLGIALSLFAFAQLVHIALELRERLGARGRLHDVLTHVVQLAGMQLLIVVALRKAFDRAERRKHRRWNLDAGDVDVLGIETPVRLLRRTANRPGRAPVLALL